MKKKRDLQGLRGLAISSVLLFHFFPSAFPNGYLGVDQFFVLSGYLMTMIFGSKELTKQTIQLFYYRRIKRILPLYVAVLLTVYILMLFLLPPTFHSLNKETATRAALLVSNMAKKQSNNDYFVLLEQAADLFTHTWSLSCELQFYLLAPAIFILFSSSFIVSSLCFSLMFSFSLGYHIFADSQTSFNSVLCRLWQFQIGMAAFYYDTSLEKHLEKGTEAEEKESLIGTRKPNQSALFPLFWISFLLLIFCSLCPYSWPSKGVRILSTVVSGTVIALGSQVQKNPLNWNQKYEDKIGCVSSFTEYPMVAHYTGLATNMSSGLLGGHLLFSVPRTLAIVHLDYLVTIFFALVLAILVTETFERWYQSLETKRVVILLAILYLLLGSVLQNTELLGQFVDGRCETFSARQNVSAEEAVKINEEYDKFEYPNLIIKNCYPNDQEHGFCSFPEGNGSNRILVLGNSYATNLAPLVYETFGGIGGNISKISNSYCEVLTTDSSNQNFQCESSFAMYKTVARNFEPDILFIIARTTKTEAEFENPAKIEDEIFNEMKKTLDEYETMVRKKVYILSSVPKVSADHIRKLNQFVQENTTKLFEEDVNQTFLNGQKRINRLSETCSKCEVFDFNRVLLDANGKDIETRQNFPGSVVLFDPQTKISYFTSGSHFTAAGMAALRPIFERLAKNFKE